MQIRMNALEKLHSYLEIQNSKHLPFCYEVIEGGDKQFCLVFYFQDKNTANKFNKKIFKKGITSQKNTGKMKAVQERELSQLKYPVIYLTRDDIICLTSNAFFFDDSPISLGLKYTTQAAAKIASSASSSSTSSTMTHAPSVPAHMSLQHHANEKQMALALIKRIQGHTIVSKGIGDYQDWKHNIDHMNNPEIPLPQRRIARGKKSWDFAKPITVNKLHLPTGTMQEYIYRSHDEVKKAPSKDKNKYKKFTRKTAMNCLYLEPHKQTFYSQSKFKLGILWYEQEVDRILVRDRNGNLVEKYSWARNARTNPVPWSVLKGETPTTGDAPYCSLQETKKLHKEIIRRGDNLDWSEHLFRMPKQFIGGLYLRDVLSPENIIFILDKMYEVRELFQQEFNTPILHMPFGSGNDIKFIDYTDRLQAINMVNNELSCYKQVPENLKESHRLLTQNNYQLIKNVVRDSLIQGYENHPDMQALLLYCKNNKIEIPLMKSEFQANYHFYKSNESGFYQLFEKYSSQGNLTSLINEILKLSQDDSHLFIFRIVKLLGEKPNFIPRSPIGNGSLPNNQEVDFCRAMWEIYYFYLENKKYSKAQYVRRFIRVSNFQFDIEKNKTYLNNLLKILLGDGTLGEDIRYLIYNIFFLLMDQVDFTTDVFKEIFQFTTLLDEEKVLVAFSFLNTFLIDVPTKFLAEIFLKFLNYDSSFFIEYFVNKKDQLPSPLKEEIFKLGNIYYFMLNQGISFSDFPLDSELVLSIFISLKDPISASLSSSSSSINFIDIICGNADFQLDFFSYVETNFCRNFSYIDSLVCQIKALDEKSREKFFIGYIKYLIKKYNTSNLEMIRLRMNKLMDSFTASVFSEILKEEIQELICSDISESTFSFLDKLLSDSVLAEHHKTFIVIKNVLDKILNPDSSVLKGEKQTFLIKAASFLVVKHTDFFKNKLEDLSFQVLEARCVILKKATTEQEFLAYYPDEIQFLHSMLISDSWLSREDIIKQVITKIRNLVFNRLVLSVNNLCKFREIFPVDFGRFLSDKISSSQSLQQFFSKENSFQMVLDLAFIEYNNQTYFSSLFSWFFMQFYSKKSISLKQDEVILNLALFLSSTYPGELKKFINRVSKQVETPINMAKFLSALLTDKYKIDSIQVLKILDACSQDRRDQISTSDMADFIQKNREAVYLYLENHADAEWIDFIFKHDLLFQLGQINQEEILLHYSDVQKFMHLKSALTYLAPRNKNLIVADKFIANLSKGAHYELVERLLEIFLGIKFSLECALSNIEMAVSASQENVVYKLIEKIQFTDQDQRQVFALLEKLIIAKMYTAALNLMGRTNCSGFEFKPDQNQQTILHYLAKNKNDIHAEKMFVAFSNLAKDEKYKQDSFGMAPIDYVISYENQVLVDLLTKDKQSNFSEKEICEIIIFYARRLQFSQLNSFIQNIPTISLSAIYHRVLPSGQKFETNLLVLLLDKQQYQLFETVLSKITYSQEDMDLQSQALDFLLMSFKEFPIQHRELCFSRLILQKFNQSQLYWLLKHEIDLSDWANVKFLLNLNRFHIFESSIRSVFENIIYKFREQTDFSSVLQEFIKKNHAKLGAVLAADDLIVSVFEICSKRNDFADFIRYLFNSKSPPYQAKNSIYIQLVYYNHVELAIEMIDQCSWVVSDSRLAKIIRKIIGYIQLNNSSALLWEDGLKLLLEKIIGQISPSFLKGVGEQCMPLFLKYAPLKSESLVDYINYFLKKEKIANVLDIIEKYHAQFSFSYIEKILIDNINLMKECHEQRFCHLVYDLVCRVDSLTSGFADRQLNKLLIIYALKSCLESALNSKTNCYEKHIRLFLNALYFLNYAFNDEEAKLLKAYFQQTSCSVIEAMKEKPIQIGALNYALAYDVNVVIRISEHQTTAWEYALQLALNGKMSPIKCMMKWSNLNALSTNEQRQISRAFNTLKLFSSLANYLQSNNYFSAENKMMLLMTSFIELINHSKSETEVLSIYDGVHRLFQQNTANLSSKHFFFKKEEGILAKELEGWGKAPDVLFQVVKVIKNKLLQVIAESNPANNMASTTASNVNTISSDRQKTIEILGSKRSLFSQTQSMTIYHFLMTPDKKSEGERLLKIEIENVEKELAKYGFERYNSAADMPANTAAQRNSFLNTFSFLTSSSASSNSSVQLNSSLGFNPT